MSSFEELEAYLERQVRATEAKIMQILAYAGETCVNVARGSQGLRGLQEYIDRTGNLRSSVGYVLIKDGAVVLASEFKVVKQGEEGSMTGEGFARGFAGKFPQGITLVVVAGMDYAEHVVRNKRDVLDSAELSAEVLVPQLLKKLFG